MDWRDTEGFDGTPWKPSLFRMSPPLCGTTEGLKALPRALHFFCNCVTRNSC
jgi:hypothetical protein